MNFYDHGLPHGSVIILQALVGSTVHGTSVSGTDDRDEMAICIEPPEKVVGLHHFETMVYRTQPEGVRSGPGDLDLVIHSLRKFARLAAKGNPSILLPLYVPTSGLIGKTHALGHALRSARSMFLSKRVGKSFLGYLERELRDSLDTTDLPADPDEVAIDRFIVSAYMSMWVAHAANAARNAQ